MQYIAAVCALLAIIGQVANFVLNLKLHTAILESERRVLEKVKLEYVPREICELHHDALEAAHDAAAAPGDEGLALLREIATMLRAKRNAGGGSH